MRADAWWMGGRGATALSLRAHRKPGMRAVRANQSARMAAFRAGLSAFLARGGDIYACSLEYSEVYSVLHHRYDGFMSCSTLCISLPNCRRKRTTAGR